MNTSGAVDIKEIEKHKHSLSGKDLMGANLGGVILTCGNLKDTKLNNAYLVDAVLLGADLSQSDFSGANLTGAKMNNADLRDANFRGAILKAADLRFCANLSRKQVDEAITDDKTLLPTYL